MKSAKNMLVSIVSMVVVLSSSSSHLVAGGSAGPGFEIFNKATAPITVALAINGTLTVRNVPANGKFEFSTHPSNKIHLGIYSQPTTGIQAGGINPIYFTPKPTYECNLDSSPYDKTKYVSWNPAKSPKLYPQTGKYMGITETSDTGYSLSNNIKQSDIKP